jgi:hypothetical protein
VKVVLYASSDAPDTDFVAKLVGIYRRRELRLGNARRCESVASRR